MEKAQPRTNGERRLLKEKISAIVAGAIALSLLVGLVLLAWQRSTEPALTDYEGIVVDRWGAYSESQQGSRPFFRLLVESPDGKRFTVRVDASVYESARVGMIIKSKAGQIALIDPAHTPNIGK